MPVVSIPSKQLATGRHGDRLRVRRRFDLMVEFESVMFVFEVFEVRLPLLPLVLWGVLSSLLDHEELEVEVEVAEELELKEVEESE